MGRVSWEGVGNHYFDSATWAPWGQMSIEQGHLWGSRHRQPGRIVGRAEEPRELIILGAFISIFVHSIAGCPTVVCSRFALDNGNSSTLYCQGRLVLGAQLVHVVRCLVEVPRHRVVLRQQKRELPDSDLVHPEDLQALLQQGVLVTYIAFPPQQWHLRVVGGFLGNTRMHWFYVWLDHIEYTQLVCRVRNKPPEGFDVDP